MNKILEIAVNYVGCPSVKYKNRNTGNTPEGFDCSGFIQYVLLESGIPVSNVAGTDRKIRNCVDFFDGFGVAVHEEVRKEGDLVFFTKDGTKPQHIGFYIKENQIIHSPGRTGEVVEICSIDSMFTKPIRLEERLDKRPVIYVRNPIGYKRPAIPNSKSRYKTLI